jgi:hypothetical protein
MCILWACASNRTGVVGLFLRIVRKSYWDIQRPGTGGVILLFFFFRAGIKIFRMTCITAMRYWHADPEGSARRY